MASPSFRRGKHPSLASQRNRDSSSVRDSVYNVFLELGGMDQHSGIAELMFSEADSDVSSRDRAPTSVRFRETSNGSRFRESFNDSDSEYESDGEDHHIAAVRRSRASRLLDRVRSRSRTRLPAEHARKPANGSRFLAPPPSSAPIQRKKSLFDRRSRTTVAADDNLLSPPKRTFTLFRSKSSTNVRELYPSNLSRSSSRETVTPRSSMPETISTPVEEEIVSPAMVPIPASPLTFDEDEWERLSSGQPSLSPSLNPFLHGPAGDLKVPTDSESGLRRFSLRQLVRGNKRASRPPPLEPLRRTRSDSKAEVEATASPPPLLRSVSEIPPTPIADSLSTSLTKH